MKKLWLLQVLLELRPWLSARYWAWQQARARRDAIRQAYLEAARREYGVTGDLSGLDARTKEEWRCMTREIEWSVDIIRRGDPLNRQEWESMAVRLERAARGERQ